MKGLTGKWVVLLTQSKPESKTHILSLFDSIVAPKIGLALRSINASLGRVEIIVTANSERGDHIRITTPFENVSERNNTLHMLSTNDETRKKLQDKVSELSVPGTHFDRQPHAHHTLQSSKSDRRFSSSS